MLKLDLHKPEVWHSLAPACRYRAAELAKQAAASHTHLTRCSQSLFKTTPQKILDTLRLLAAPAVLERELSVKVTAERLGISQRSQLSRDFTRFYGVSPKAYLLLSKAEKVELEMRIKTQLNGSVIKCIIPNQKS